ncbi:hypothetical protein NZNM25_09160 [Nitrosopumilus zosterae]|uniref:PEFG-CTERM sorting domain-containing protein n=1 Tax=Nitrosopumilus zosterae TaxID=718286 RepID=A0A2S2KRP1_9ARCH|nr:hypothetical protein [Nitrosopumilus zosterae]BDQ30442.1 hypothetical protein NZOSNM25_000545 [Nitrosopumilus zosterae]GBH34125.1 hypothetical protein NZNM25_09160 [Nitrosopumilus zosterae]
MNNVNKLQSDRLKPFPNVSSLLKISLGLVLFTIISTALVYAETISVDVGGTSYNVDYTATGMTLDAIEADLDFVSLILAVSVPDSDATLDITFERSFFDSTFDGLDDDFIILVDGDEPTFTETETTTQSRTLSIDLPAGTEEIEIIGSSFGESASVPEETPVEEPVEETPVEEPVEETPVEEPVVEETPVVTTPKVEEKPVVTTPKVQCGPGTILKDGTCVLDERCGPGTVLKDGACVLDSPPVLVPAETSVKGMGKETIVAFVAAFVIAGTVGVILALISKASKSSN